MNRSVVGEYSIEILFLDGFGLYSMVDRCLVRNENHMDFLWVGHVSFGSGWSRNSYVTENNFELLILLFLSLLCWDLRHVPPAQDYMVLGIQPKALWVTRLAINQLRYTPDVILYIRF